MKFFLLCFCVAFYIAKASEYDWSFILDPYQEAYDKVLAKRGRGYMNSIDFIQQNYSGVQAVDGEEFDFIIVGAGPAGSVLANRLSEIEGWNVLLLEAGYEAPVLNDVSALAGVWALTDYCWMDLMERTSGIAEGMEDERMFLPKGRGLGGGTIINFMVFTRGNRRDYDHWSELGNPGWSYNEVLPYFKKLETTLIANQDSRYRGQFGPVNSEDTSHRSQMVEVFLEAAKERGDEILDYNGRKQLGTSYLQATLRRGLRVNAEKAYLRPAKTRRNLKIQTGSFVTEILFGKGSPPTANGVKYIRDGRIYTARAKKEVILSAGTFNTPKLLMLSGIGPKDHLEGYDIPVKVDSPVGENMYDHLAFFGVSFEVNQSITFQLKDLGDPSQMDRLAENGTGNLNSILVEALRFIRTDKADSNEDGGWPDVELMLWPTGMGFDSGSLLRKTFMFRDDVYNKFWKPLEGKNIWQPVVMLLRPRSNGYVKLRSRDPMEPMYIQGNHLTRREDVNAFVEGIREAIRMSETAAFQKYGSKLVDIPIPGCENLTFNSHQYWECGLRIMASSIHHSSSTCRMGPDTDDGAVVDNRARVYGVRNLRIADVSILPVTVSGHTMVPSYMIGERVSDFIKEDYGAFKLRCA